MRPITMYGLVNRSLEDLVLTRYGEEVWRRIQSRAGIELDTFISNEEYADSVTISLVVAAEDELGMPREQLLRAFGEHWILRTAVESYGAFIHATGSTLPEFLRNLPLLHSRIGMVFPKLHPPRFELEEGGDARLLVHYRSKRQGLTAMVEGMLLGLGKHFRSPVRVALILTETEGEGGTHAVYEVTWNSQA